MGRIRQHLNYANVMVTLLAFVVLGGGAYAALRLPPNSVKSKQIKNGAVKSPDVRNDGLTGIDISGLTAADLAANAVGTVQIQNGAVQAEDIAGSALPFQLGDGTAAAESVQTLAEDSEPNIFEIPGVGAVAISCLAAGDFLVFSNDAGSTDDVWFDADHRNVAQNSVSFGPALSTEDRVQIMILDQGRVVSVDVAFFEQANGNCTYAATLQENTENAFP